jgi:hypothetical protein
MGSIVAYGLMGHFTILQFCIEIAFCLSSLSCLSCLPCSSCLSCLSCFFLICLYPPKQFCILHLNRIWINLQYGLMGHFLSINWSYFLTLEDLFFIFKCTLCYMGHLGYVRLILASTHNALIDAGSALFVSFCLQIQKKQDTL